MVFCSQKSPVFGLVSLAGAFFFKNLKITLDKYRQIPDIIHVMRTQETIRLETKAMTKEQEYQQLIQHALRKLQNQYGKRIMLYSETATLTFMDFNPYRAVQAIAEITVDAIRWTTLSITETRVTYLILDGEKLLPLTKKE